MPPVPWPGLWNAVRDSVRGPLLQRHHTLPPLPEQLTHRAYLYENSDEDTSECGESTDSDEV